MLEHMDMVDFLNLLKGKVVKEARCTDARTNEIDIEFEDGDVLAITHSGDDMSYVQIHVTDETGTRNVY
jgi:hypothetical protein